jgi:hypothetical protein
VLWKGGNPEFLPGKEDYLNMAGNFGRNRKFAGYTGYGKINLRKVTGWQRNLSHLLERSF